MEQTWPLSWSIPVFALAALTTIAGGIRLASAGDVLADRTGLGEAVFGAVLFGGVISASGIVMSAVSAAGGQPQLAYSNALGGIAAQTAALGVADVFHRKANLEHAAASLPNMMSAVLLIELLVLVLLVGTLPSFTLAGIHPASGLLVAAYVFGFRLVQKTHRQPLWFPKMTSETSRDEPEVTRSGQTTRRLWIEFGVLGVTVSAAGWAVARAAASFVSRGGVEESFAGAFLMGLVNAMPEAVTAVAAVKRGALTLAMAAVLGGNAFDVLNLVVADVAYRSGSIYHAAGSDDVFLCAASTLMTAVLLGGMLRREVRGPGRVGSETVLMLSVYALTLVVLFLPD